MYTRYTLMSQKDHMPVPTDRRSRKRLATRQSISDVATRLFNERGFDQVTVNDIADAADIGRKTVFNHFARKEDMFFDLDEAAREDMCAALQHRDRDVAPLEALRLFAHRIVLERAPYIRFFDGSVKFMDTIDASATLKARARAIRDEVTASVAAALAGAVGREPGDPDAQLAATLLVASWAFAFMRAHETYRQHADEGAAQQAFLAIVDRGALGVNAALAGTPYVSPGGLAGG
jgi:AcrR family transcriptional regulator